MQRGLIAAVVLFLQITASLALPSSADALTKVIILTSGTSWTVPSDWNSSNNTIEVIGGGGGADNNVGTPGNGGGGGGGGAYAKAINVSLPPATSIIYSVGAAGSKGTGSGGAGGDTYFCNSTSNCSNITGSAVVAGAKGGGGTSGSTGGTGGVGSSGIGATKFNGGDGGNGGTALSNSGGGGGGGGGAAGPNGAGNTGGVGKSPPSGQNGGDGGSGDAGQGGVTGTGGSGNGGTGGTGGAGTEFDASHGAGAGGGGGGGGFISTNGGNAGNAGSFGAGGSGGGGAGSSAPSAGAASFAAPGIIVITYMPRTTLLKPPNNLGLVGYWSFNEGSGNYAADFSGNGNTSALVNSPTWTGGKLSRALSFNGSNTFVNAGSSATLTNAPFTYAAWIKPTSTGNPEAIIGTTGATTQRPEFRIETNGNVGLQDQGIVSIGTSVGTVTYGAWNHVVVSYDASGNYTFYINGVASGSGTNLQTLVNAETDIGGASASDYFSGTIDEVRIYNRVLAASDVQKLYLSGAVRVNGSSADLDNGSSLERGLVGLWTMDGQDTNWSTGIETDRSGNGNNGRLNNMSTTSTPTIGKLGQALSFDGSATFVSVGSIGAVNTVSFWIKANTTASQNIINIDGTNLVGTNGSSQVVGASFPAATVYVDGQTSPTTIDTGWHFVTIVDTTGVSATTFEIGRAGAIYFNGIIDDVRVYNRALSASEIKQLYKLGTAIVRPN